MTRSHTRTGLALIALVGGGFLGMFGSAVGGTSASGGRAAESSRPLNATATLTSAPTATATNTLIPTAGATATATATLPAATLNVSPNPTIAPFSESVVGTGFKPNENVTVTFVPVTTTGLSPQRITAQAGPDGTFFAPDLPVPANTLSGTYTVSAIGQTSGKTATASLQVVGVSPSPTASVVPTATLVPTATSTPPPTSTAIPTMTSTATASPTATATSVPEVVIDKVLVLHKSGSKNVSTKVLHMGERGDFYLLYTVTNADSQQPKASLTITKNGKLLVKPKLQSLILGHHPAFGAHVILKDGRDTGKLYAHFRISLGTVSEKRDRRFYLQAKK